MLVQGCNNASRGVDTQALPERPVEEFKYTVHLPLMDAEGRGGKQGTWVPTPPHPTQHQHLRQSAFLRGKRRSTTAT
jgi:hypothetical protein